MPWISTKIKDVWVFEPKIWLDQRGYFVETYRQDLMLTETGQNILFVQDNEAKSTRGVLRGLHYQLAPNAQTKLVRAVQGEVLDVIVDLRQDSKTYGQHFSIILNDINKKQLLVPQGFAHGYLVLSLEAIFAYKCDNYYSQKDEGGLHYADPQLGINWMIDHKELIISEKDAVLPFFSEHRK